MGWQMDSHGNWTNSSGSGTTKESSSSLSAANGGGDNKPQDSGSDKTITDRGNTSETKESIKDSTENKTVEIKYAEEANFTADGDHKIRKGCYLKIRKGVADRWTGKWLILETTHTVDVRGYKVEGVLGKIPYKEKTQKSKSPKKKSNGSSTKESNGTAKKSTVSESKSESVQSKKSSDSSVKAASGSDWKMKPDGTWYKG